MEGAKRMIRWLVFAGTVVSAALNVSADGGQVPVTLERGKVTVVTAPKTMPLVRFAAEEMTNILSRVLGAQVPWRTELPAEGTAIILGTNGWSVAAGLAPEKLPRDGYRVRTAPNRVYIAGCDDPQGYISWKLFHSWYHCYERGTLNGVYGFLERFAGVRFYFPGEIGTVIPESPRIEIPATDLSDAPKLAIRRFSYGDCTGEWPDKVTKEEHIRLATLNRLRLRMETIYVPCCHGLYTAGFAPRFAEKHPEYFRLRKNGTRHTEDTRRQPQCANAQLCHSSDVWSEIHDDVVAYFTGKDAKTRGFDRWAQQTSGGKYYDVMPNDGMAKCCCEKCQAWYAKAKDPQYWATPLVWSRTVELANRLKAEGVKGTITQMAYSSYRGLPDFDIPDNVAVMVAEMGPWGYSDKKRQAKDKAEILAWKDRVAGGVWLWNYIGKFQCAGLNVSAVPCTTPNAIGRYYAEMGDHILGAYAEADEVERFIYSYLNFYVFSRMMWDPKTDYKAVIAEHHRLMFGAGAAEMTKFFELIEKKWIFEVQGPTFDGPMGSFPVAMRDYEVWSNIWTPTAIAKLDGYAAAALAKVRPGSMAAKRIAYMRERFVGPMQAESKKQLEAIDIAAEEKYRASSTRRTIVSNGSFDTLDGWEKTAGECSLDTFVYRSKPGALKLVSTDDSPADKGPFLRAAATLPLPELKENHYYRLSWYERLENVAPLDVNQSGFSMCICDTVDRSFPWPSFHVGTMDWFRQTYEFKARPGSNDKGQSYIRPRLTHCTGTVWIDDIRLEECK